MHPPALANALKYFETRDGVLRTGGRPISELVASFGTPFYVYDLGVAHRKVARLREALPDSVRIHYAMKANPHPEVVRSLVSLGLGLDVASAGELETAMAAGVDPGICGFAGPGKSVDELRQAISSGIGLLNVESEREVELAQEVARELGKTARVAIRVNPPFALQRSGMQMNGGPSVFGIDLERVPALLCARDSYPNLEFRGFHVFAGSQNLRAAAIVEFLGLALDALEDVCRDTSFQPASINLGGGFGVPYFGQEEELDVETVGTELGKLLAKHAEVFSGTRFLMETGRYLVAECGIYVTRVRYRKESRGKTFLVVEGGLNHHLAATGNFGQVIRKNFPIAALEKLERPEDATYTITGPLCTPLDVLGSGVTMPLLNEGDLIGVFASGAYGFSASPHGFLSHPLPKELVVGGRATPREAATP